MAALVNASVGAQPRFDPLPYRISFMKKMKFSNPRSMLAILLLLFLVYAALSVLPSRQIRIAAGPEGGSFYDVALQYKKILEKRGYRVAVVPFQNTDEIAANVADERQHFDIGFVANDLNEKNPGNLVSLGEIQLQPIFVFANKKFMDAGKAYSFADLRGMSLVLPPEKSVTSQTLLSIFALYGMNRDNTPIRFLPLNDGIAQLKQGKFDAGLFILGAESDLMADLARDPALVLMQVTHQEAITKRLPFLKQVTIPSGIFDLGKNLPTHDTPLLAASISVAARRNLPAATTYALLEAMQDVHRKSSYVNRPNEFPKYTGAGTPTDNRVEEFYRNGTPWIYSNFPIAMASVIDAYQAPLLALWFLVGAVGAVTQLEKIKFMLLLIAAYMAIFWVRRRTRRGSPIAARDRALIIRLEAEMDRDGHGIQTLLSELRRLGRS